MKDMLKHLLATAALAVLLAQGAVAQEQAPASDPMAPAADPMAPAAPAATGDWVVDENFQPVEVAGLTAEQIIGADVRTADGTVIATVKDLVLGADGKAEGFSAKFGGFLGFGSNTVTLGLDEVELMQNDAGTVALRTPSRRKCSKAARPTGLTAGPAAPPLRAAEHPLGGLFCRVDPRRELA